MKPTILYKAATSLPYIMHTWSSSVHEITTYFTSGSLQWCFTGPVSSSLCSESIRGDRSQSLESSLW